jgi:hypothetical protein
VVFERFADDIVVHCKTRRQAEQVAAAIAGRLGELGLRLHPDKAKIVYCKDGRRRSSHEHTSFDFLGFTFRAREARAKDGRKFLSFLPAMSQAAMKAKSAAWPAGSPPAGGRQPRPDPARRPAPRRTRTSPAGNGRSCRRGSRSRPGATPARRAACPDRASRCRAGAFSAACGPAGHQPTATSRNCRCCGRPAAPGAPPSAAAPRSPRPGRRSSPPARRSLRPRRRRPRSPGQAVADRSQATMIRAGRT